MSTLPILVTTTGKQYRLSLTAETRIGSRGCAVTISAPGIAPQHARITPSKGQFVIEDLGGGVKVNNSVVTGPTRLQSGDVITIGQISLTFYQPGVSPGQAPGQPPRPAPPQPPKPLTRPHSANAVPSLPRASLAAKQRGERILWQGRPRFLLSPAAWLATRYKLTDERLQVKNGFLSESLEEIELLRIKDIHLQRGLLQRFFSVGTITIYTVDQTAPQLRLHHIPKADRVREAIRNAVRDERRKHGGHFIELIK